MQHLRIGTSGWSYNDWIGKFYPEGIEKRDMLPHYMKHYDTVELNASFYRIPFPNMIKGWRNKAPEGFRFAVKGIRRITHYNKLREVEDEVERFLDRVRGLQQHLGPMLWQLPPTLDKDVGRLRNFLELLPGDLNHAIEFRDESWLDDEVYGLLKEYNAALVWVSSGQMPMDATITADFVYMRFHGLSGGYDYDYSKEELEPWVDEIVDSLGEGRDTYVFFNNDKDAMAIKNIGEIKEMIENKYEES